MNACVHMQTHKYIDESSKYIFIHKIYKHNVINKYLQTGTIIAVSLVKSKYISHIININGIIYLLVSM